MDDRNRRIEGVRRAYRRAHLHLDRMLEGLTNEVLQTEVPGANESISRVLQHILNAESYWLDKVHEPHPDYVKRPDLAITRSLLDRLQSAYLDLLDRRGQETGVEPNPAWIALRVSHHTLYHSGQIALLRRILGVPSVPVGERAPLTWESAVDEITAMALGEG